jgi:hypothetical protein
MSAPLHAQDGPTHAIVDQVESAVLAQVVS